MITERQIPTEWLCLPHIIPVLGRIASKCGKKTAAEVSVSTEAALPGNLLYIVFATEQQLFCNS